MLLYTIFSPEEVLAEVEETTKEEEPFAVTMEGKKFLISPEGPGRGRILQLLSTDPADFLDSRWEPGNMIIWLKPD